MLTDIGSIVTYLLGEFTNILALFVTEPILVLLLGLMVMGAIIGLTMRVVHRR